MKNIYLLFTFLITFSSFSQTPRQEKIKELKIGFITKELNLTSEEAQVFWPIYNKHEEEKEVIRTQINSLIRKLDVESLTEKEAQDILNRLVELESKNHNFRHQFTQDLKTALTAKKILNLLETEREFKRKMMNQIRGKHRKRQ